AAHLAQLAHHALAAVPVLDGAVAAAHAQRAGTQAMRVYAFDEAARAFAGALAALDAAAAEDGARRGAALLDLAEAKVKGGDPPTLAHALSAGLYVAWGRKPAADVLPVADEIVALAERSADPERAFDGRMWRLIARLELGDLDAAERELHAVEQLAERLRQP